MKVLLLAGEESGALYAQSIREALLRRVPAAEVRGYADYGFELADLAVIGFWAVLKRAFYFLRVKRTMERAIAEWRPDVVCTVDYPGLNLKLAAFAKRRGVRAVHVVCPQVWAWKRGRIPQIEAALDRLCCFFPFEPALFRAGFATFVGHPLADAFASASAVVRAPDAPKTLALLPGSRMGEIERHLPVLLAAVSRLAGVRAVVPAANERAFRLIEAQVRAAGVSAVSVVRGGAREVLRTADAAVVASGTATLEAALANCPTVLVYRVGWLFAAVMRRLIKGIRHLGLANILAEKAGAPCPMPELIQEDFTVERVLAAVRPWLEDAAANASARRHLQETMRLLQSDGKAIERIVECLR